jgi:ABC-2 type transport system permease protein
VTVTELADTGSDAEALLRDNQVDVAFVTGEAPTLALVDGSNLFAAQAIVSALKQGRGERSDAGAVQPRVEDVVGDGAGDHRAHSHLHRRHHHQHRAGQEREAGTLEQLALMAIKPSTVILGKITPHFLLASVDMLIVTVLGMVLFDVPFNGNPFAFALGIFLFVVLGLGVPISTVSYTAGQAIQTALLLLLPQIPLSGMIFPLDAMAAGVRWIGYLLPLTYFIVISQGILLRGASIASLWYADVILSVMAGPTCAGAGGRPCARSSRSTFVHHGSGLLMSLRDVSMLKREPAGPGRAGIAKWCDEHHCRCLGRDRGRVSTVCQSVRMCRASAMASGSARRCRTSCDRPTAQPARSHTYEWLQ